MLNLLCPPLAQEQPVYLKPPDYSQIGHWQLEEPVVYEM
jgi:hypothetical protein